MYFSALLGLASAIALAGEHGLVARGFVTGNTLHLTLENEGSEPEIILTRHYAALGIRLFRQPFGQLLAEQFAFPSRYRGSVDRRWETLEASLDRKVPPPHLTRTLKPGESWSVDIPVGLPPHSNNAGERRGPLWMTVLIELWPINIEPYRQMSELRYGKQLRRRWRRFGELAIDNLWTQPVRIDDVRPLLGN